eukprot:5090763-Ditylum_brightwellii.AAC.1
MWCKGMMDKIVDSVRRDDIWGAIVYRLWDDCGLASSWIAMMYWVFSEVVRCDRGGDWIGRRQWWRSCCG